MIAPHTFNIFSDAITQEYDEDYVANSYSKYRSYDMKYESRTNC